MKLEKKTEKTEEFLLDTERSEGREVSVCTTVLLKSCTTPGFKDTILKTFLEKMEDKKSDHFWVSFI